MYAATPIGSHIAAIVSKKISCTLAYAIGTTLYIVSILLVLILKTEVTHYLLPFGIIQGIAQGFYFFSANVISQYITNEDNRERFNSIVVIITNISTIVIPLITSLCIYLTKSYIPIFIAAFVSFLLSGTSIFSIKVTYTHGNLHLSTFLQKVIHNKDMINSFLSMFYSGIFWAVRAVVLPVVTLTILPNIAIWGIFNRDVWK